MDKGIKEKHDNRQKEILNAVNEIPKTIGRTYALAPDKILSHLLGKEDVLELNKEKKLVIFQQDLMVALMSTSSDEWSDEFGLRLISLTRGTLFMPSEVKNVFSKECENLRKFLGLKCEPQ